MPTTLYFFFWNGFAEVAAVEAIAIANSWPMTKNRRRNRR